MCTAIQTYKNSWQLQTSQTTCVGTSRYQSTYTAAVPQHKSQFAQISHNIDTIGQFTTVFMLGVHIFMVQSLIWTTILTSRRLYFYKYNDNNTATNRFLGAIAQQMHHDDNNITPIIKKPSFEVAPTTLAETTRHLRRSYSFQDKAINSTASATLAVAQQNVFLHWIFHVIVHFDVRPSHSYSTLTGSSWTILPNT